MSEKQINPVSFIQSVNDVFSLTSCLFVSFGNPLHILIGTQKIWYFFFISWMLGCNPHFRIYICYSSPYVDWVTSNYVEGMPVKRNF